MLHVGMYLPDGPTPLLSYCLIAFKKCQIFIGKILD
jgi:hypothetical protein